MSEEAVWGALPVSILLFGTAVVWFTSWQAHRRGSSNPFASSGNRSWALIGYVIGIGLMLVGGAFSVIFTALFFSPILLFCAVVILLAAAVRYWRSDMRYLVWTLAEAAERSIPLDRAARAFAAEQSGFFSRSARTLADYVDAGVPLSVAMSRARIGASPDIKVAADLGEKTNTLGTTLRQSIERGNAFDDAMGTLALKFFYLGGLVFAMVAVATFMLMKIVPTFEEMFEEFELALPGGTIAVLYVSKLFVTYWYLLLPLLLGFFLIALVTLLLFIGVPLQFFPVLRRLGAPAENANILSTLSASVRRKQSIVDSVHLLSGLMRLPSARRRMTSAATSIEQGVHWSEALQQAGIITKAHNAVFRAAERAGNLDWALAEVADSTVRRLVQRAHAVLAVVFPACLVLFAVCIFFFGIGMMLPLFTLIYQLA